METEWFVATKHRDIAFELRASDLMYTWVHNVPIGYLLDELVNVEHLKEGLASALELYPILCGRLRKGESKKLVIDLKDSKGCPLQVVRDSKSVAPESKDSLGTESWDPFFVAGLNKIVPQEPKPSEPLFRARLTLLEKSKQSVLTMSFVHAVMDGASIIAFIHAWSHFACVAAQSPLVPSQEPFTPHLDRRLELSSRDMENLLESRSDEDEDLDGQLTWKEFFKFVTEQVVTNPWDIKADFVLQLADVKKLKEEVSKRLPEGEWVSSYEVMLAILLKAQALVDDIWAEREGKSEGKLRARVLVNTRGRERFSPANYCGNALAFCPIELEGSGLNPSTEKYTWVAQLAMDIHAQLRTILSQPSKLERIHLLMEQGVRTGGMTRSRFARLRHYKSWALAYLQKSPICNSWIGYDWFNVTFGTSNKPKLMRVPKQFSYRRHIFIAPRTEDQVLVRIQLASNEMQKFIEAVARLDLPLVRLDKEPTVQQRTKSRTAVDREKDGTLLQVPQL